MVLRSVELNPLNLLHVAHKQADTVFSLDIADIIWSISCDNSKNSIHMDEAYHGFYCCKEPEVTIHTHQRGLPQIHWQDLQKIFDSEMVWSLYEGENEFVFALKSPVIGPSPYGIAVFDKDFRHGNIFNNLPPIDTEHEEILTSPLAYPLAEALMICLLSLGRGVMMHASGVVDHGHGYLFVGNSTHGKSTMAKLWKDQAVVLNDDRIIIRYQDKRFWIYGTPWHGEFNAVSAQKAPLEKIFILSHNEENLARRITGINAVSMLLTRCFPPFWNKKGMDFTLDFYSRMIEAIPCYSLGFRPDIEVVDFVRCVN